MALDLYDFPPKDTQPQSNGEKKTNTSVEAQWRDILQNAKPVLLKTVRSSSKTRKLFEELTAKRSLGRQSD